MPKGINRYIDNSIARTRTVGILIKCIELLLKYSSTKLPVKVRQLSEQCLAEYEFAVNQKTAGHTKTRWAKEDYLSNNN